MNRTDTVLPSLSLQSGEETEFPQASGEVERAVGEPGQQRYGFLFQQRTCQLHPQFLPAGKSVVSMEDTGESILSRCCSEMQSQSLDGFSRRISGFSGSETPVPLCLPPTFP